MSENPESVQKTSASGQAVAAFVCGLCAVLFGSWCCCLWLPLGVIAMVLGKQEERAIAEGRSPVQGRALAQWGFWLGLVGLIMGVLLVVVISYFLRYWLTFPGRLSHIRSF
ncbi:MAG: DUF4190 domain-containing protein [bacterium]|jgi:polyferredoxin|nr:DUF4190 domain-containing protein [candidate division KSB1 bacterium]MDH7561365.1 DUF4190 domain-containing protein [bacterium]